MLRIALAAALAVPPLAPYAPHALPAAAATPSAAHAPAAPVPPSDSAAQLAEVYAAATARLLDGASGEGVVLLPTPDEAGDVAVRARRASGPAQRASAATARRVAAILARRGVRGVQGGIAAGTRNDAVQLVLGELRYEPGQAPRFARLRIVVVGADGARSAMNFLMRKDATGWTTLNMESAASIG